MDKAKQQYEEQLEEQSLKVIVVKMLEIYKNGSDKPLDKEDTKRLSQILLAEIDLQEGNISPEQYDKIVKNATGALVRCPNNPLHDRFITTAHEIHDWVVDSKGNFVQDLGCSEVAAKPDVNNIWVCKICGEEAEVL